MKSPKAKSQQDGDLKAADKLVVVAKESKAIKKKQKSKKPKETNGSKKAVGEVVKETAKNLTAIDIAKIEKKKAKKQAQKAKKQERKSVTETLKKVPKTVAKVAVKSSEENKSSAVVVVKETNTKKDKKQKAKAARNNDEEKDGETLRRQRTPEAEAATLFVGNLPINTKRVQLVRLFQPYSTVHSIRLRTAGGKQLFKHKQRKVAGTLNAYVVLDSKEVAQKALALNGTQFKGHNLRITPSSAKAIGPATAAADGSNGQTPNDADVKRTVFVGNLKYSANEQKLHDIFSSCGEIEYIRCLQDGEKGCKGVAYVCFQKPDAVGLALELNETVLDDRPIHVERYAVKKLGAKQARDSSAAAATPQSKSKKKPNATGAKKRLDKRDRKENGKPAEHAKSAANKKKSEYRGVKVDGIKKNQKRPQKKKTNNQMNTLAKKIAPKAKN